MNRRKFVRESVLASAGAAFAMSATGSVQKVQAEETATQPNHPSTATTTEMPCGKIANMEVSRLLLGGNLLTHYTHSRDLKYVYSLAKHYNTDEKILETLALAEDNGINTVVVHNIPSTIKLLQKHRQRGGKMQWITCTCHALVASFERFNREIEELVDAGTDALYISGVEADTLCGFRNDIAAANASERTTPANLELLAQAVDLARAHGLPTGLGAHRIGVIVDCEQAGMDVDFYLKTIHHRNYPTANIQHDSSFCPEPERVIEVMQSVRKPWIAYKVMAAGAIPPKDAFQYAFHSGADYVLAGMFDFEISEDARLIREVFPQAQRQRPQPV
ncbi:MAG: hypothetical protein JW829_05520 [Pirellulales bacterium]|nr:hypothetical protein [Pirellulales bacterium]